MIIQRLIYLNASVMIECRRDTRGNPASSEGVFIMYLFMNVTMHNLTLWAAL